MRKLNSSLMQGALLVGVSSALGIYLFSRRKAKECNENETDRVSHEKQSVDNELTEKDISREISTRSIPDSLLINSSNLSANVDDKFRILSQNTVTVVHASVTGTCSKFAWQFKEHLSQNDVFSSCKIQFGKIEEWDWWDELLNSEEEIDTNSIPPVVILVIPTHTGGSWPVEAEPLQQALQDLRHDWRIEKAPLRTTKLHFAAFGMGSSAYDDATVGRPAKEAWQQFRSLGAKVLGKPGIGDDAIGEAAQISFQKWMEQDVIPELERVYNPSTCSGGHKGEGCCQNDSDEGQNGSCCQVSTDKETGVNHGEESNNEEDFSDESDDEQHEPEVMDLEDMGDSLLQSTTEQSKEPPEMVTPSQAAALKKEGYKLIGTHSAVKLCRWTKHQLRGRGGCYKHTFYGITSYQCMEATPSLACANKCVFCWRHHKNPVGKEWRWKTDDPYMIVDEAVKAHIKLIKETKGIPGVKMDRWKEAHTVRHCALSLVGEPIMYPRIDEFLGELHNRQISTYLVTNGQHPNAISSIRPITQLYISVDAPTPESLIAIDRPLFHDAWERLQQSLSMLKDKGQRTVARLTVVKGWNSDEVSGYAKLVALGQVSLVEVKGVTFCGKSDASNLNMSNSPWHHEVVDLVKTLKHELEKLRKVDSSIPEYDIACEHKHSVCVLLARVDQFAYDDPETGRRKWRTWIDYDKFQQLAVRSVDDPSFTFGVKDYIADTPAWALYGAEEEGFDPTDTRHRKKKKHPKYTKFDEEGIPTHDHDNKELSLEKRDSLMQQMKTKRAKIGCGSTVTELRGGEKQIEDASLMFRGMVVIK
mmetsp:Transcript_519/g.782  ORF Transcript_519/g.782 Transcript_519/m.782 type:complete len:814 (+) Transcript_519:166-2607(+)